MIGQEIPTKNRQTLATNLGLDLSTFDNLITSANYAYDYMKDNGPFYGRGVDKEPTFRICAKPINLPNGSKKLALDLGNDIFHLAQVLHLLPAENKKLLGKGVDFRIPPMWRVDIILDEKGTFHLNEIEGQDGANALMMALQQAYHLQALQESTAAQLVETLKRMCIQQKNNHYKIAYLRVNNYHTPNAQRFIKYIEKISNGTVLLEHFFDDELREGTILPHWESYAGVISECSLSPTELYAFGIKEEQIVLVGNYNAIANKGVMALLFEENLKSFWLKKLGEERFDRLKHIFIPTRWIKTLDDLKRAREKGMVVKVSWAGRDTTLINRSKGLALPSDTLPHGSDERWDLLKDLLTKGVSLIAQEFIMPTQISIFLRKKGQH